MATQKLYAELEPELAKRNYVLLDLKRVLSVDVTAAHLLCNVRDVLQERGAMLLLSGVREKLPNGRNLREFLEQTGVVGTDDKAVRVFPVLDSAIEWVEERLLGEREAPAEEETPIQLQHRLLPLAVARCVCGPLCGGAYEGGCPGGRAPSPEAAFAFVHARQDGRVIGLVADALVFEAPSQCNGAAGTHGPLAQLEVGTGARHAQPSVFVVQQRQRPCFVVVTQIGALKHPDANAQTRLRRR